MKLNAQLWLPQPPAQVFPFFADARNLEAITPPWLNFSILNADPLPIQAGTRINYRLRLHGLPFRWQSEITRWEPPFGFCDEQRRGPYRRWTHVHSFLPHEGGTLCLDDVTYEVPGGRWIDRWFVRRDVLKIFEYRQRALRQHFMRIASDHVEATGGPAWHVNLDGGPALA